MTNKAEIKITDTVKLEVPLVVGTENEPALDIAQLRAKTGYVTLDPAFMNTASTKSGITFIDGDKGILRYRGIPIEQLAEQSTFVETSYLLINGHLPNRAELTRFSTLLTRHSLIHEDMKRFFEGFPTTAHPMAVLSSMVLALSSFYPEAIDVNDTSHTDMTIARLLAKVRTIAAFAYKKSIGQPMVYPKNSLKYCANFLNMMFSVPAEPYEVDEELVKVMNLLLSSTPITSKTARRRRCVSSGARARICSRRFRRGFARSGARSTAARTKKSSRCSRRSATTAAT